MNFYLELPPGDYNLKLAFLFYFISLRARCQHFYLLQPGDYSANRTETLRDEKSNTNMNDSDETSADDHGDEDAKFNTSRSPQTTHKDK